MPKSGFLDLADVDVRVMGAMSGGSNDDGPASLSPNRAIGHCPQRAFWQLGLVQFVVRIFKGPFPHAHYFFRSDHTLASPYVSPTHVHAYV